MVEFDSVGATTKKGISGFEPGHEFEGYGSSRLVFSLQEFPFALPHDDDAVTQGEQDIFFASSGFVDVAHALIVHLVTHGITVRVTLGAPRQRLTSPRLRDGKFHEKGEPLQCGAGSTKGLTQNDTRAPVSGHLKGLEI